MSGRYHSTTERIFSELQTYTFCTDCGARVDNAKRHDEFHGELDKMQRAINRVADDAYETHMRQGAGY